MSLLVICILLLLTFSPAPRNTTLAGVVGLNKFFRRRGSHAWQPASTTKSVIVDHLCIDMNQILHSSVRSKNSPTLLQCIRRIYQEIDNILRSASPTKSLVLVFDGPAPFAKLQTQRSRRSSTLENNVITPGTDFMALMESFMLGYVFQRIQRLRHLNIFISGANSPGEGEVKIIDWATNHICGMNETLMICGSDSDILLQAMILSELTNVLVFQRGKDYSDAFCNITTVIDNLANAANLTEESVSYFSSQPIDANREAYLQLNVPTSQPSTFQIYRQYLEYINSPYHPLNCITTNTVSIINTTIGSPSSVETIYNVLPLSSSSISLSSLGSSINSTWEPQDFLSDLPKSFRLDLLILFVMQGNDYLPKIRGITIDNTLLAYGKVMKSLPERKRYLLDMDKNTFNFVALYLLMYELRSDHVQLHVQLQRPVNCLYDLCQKKVIKEELLWIENTTSLESDSVTWSSSIIFNNRTYSCSGYSAKAEARNVIAIKILKDFFPDTLAEMYFKRKQAKRALRDFKRAVIKEEQEQLLALKELIPASGHDIINEILCTTPSELDSEVQKIDDVVYDEESDSIDELILHDIDTALKSNSMPNAVLTDIELMHDGWSEGTAKILANDILDKFNVETNSADLNLQSKSESGDSFESEGEYESSDEENYDNVDEDDEDIIDTSDNGLVSEIGYASYVRDSDVEEYLRGLLWVAQMYTDGVCPDISYTYMGRPPISPYLITNYISKLVWKNCMLSGIEDFDLKITIQNLYRSLQSNKNSKDSNVEMAHERQQIDKLSNVILDNKIGICTGGVTWQDLKSRIYVPRSSFRPLSADATCACLLPNVAKDDVPHHIRHVWADINTEFFEALNVPGLQSSTYHNLTCALQKVWNAKLASARSGDSYIGGSSTMSSGNSISSLLGNKSKRSMILGRSGGNSSGVASNTTQTEVRLQRVQKTTLVKSDTEEDRARVYNRLEGLIKKRGYSREGIQQQQQQQQQLKNSSFEDIFRTNLAESSNNTVVNLAIENSGSIDSKSDHPSNVDLSRVSSSTMSAEISERRRRVSGVFASPKDCHWTVVTSDRVLTRKGLFERMEVEMPLPLPISTPRFLPRGCHVLRIPQTRVSPLRRFNFYENHKSLAHSLQEEANKYSAKNINQVPSTRFRNKQQIVYKRSSDH